MKLTVVFDVPDHWADKDMGATPDVWAERIARDYNAACAGGHGANAAGWPLAVAHAEFRDMRRAKPKPRAKRKPADA